MTPVSEPVPGLQALISAFSSHGLADNIALMITLGVTLLGLFRGRTPEQVFVVANCLTLYAKSLTIHAGANVFFTSQTLAVLDMSFLVIVLPIALYSNRYWPMLAVSLIAIIVMLDVVAMISAFRGGATVNAKVTAVVWIYVLQTVVLIGTLKEGQRPTRSRPSR